MTEGHEIKPAELLFEKIEDAVIDGQLNRLAEIKKANEEAKKAEEEANWKPEEVGAPVDFETFEKLDIRCGKILDCQKVPKADKLLQFKIDDGMGGRTIVSGIAAYYKPENLIGMEVCFIANFPTRKLKGVESQGMILSAVDRDGKLVVISPSKEVAPGSKVG